MAAREVGVELLRKDSMSFSKWIFERVAVQQLTEGGERLGI